LPVSELGAAWPVEAVADAGALFAVTASLNGLGELVGKRTE